VYVVAHAAEPPAASANVTAIAATNGRLQFSLRITVVLLSVMQPFPGRLAVTEVIPSPSVSGDKGL